MKSEGIANDTRIHPVGTVHIYTKKCNPIIFTIFYLHQQKCHKKEPKSRFILLGLMNIYSLVRSFIAVDSIFVEWKKLGGQLTDWLTDNAVHLCLFLFPPPLFACSSHLSLPQMNNSEKQKIQIAQHGVRRMRIESGWGMEKKKNIHLIPGKKMDFCFWHFNGGKVSTFSIGGVSGCSDWSSLRAGCLSCGSQSVLNYECVCVHILPRSALRLWFLTGGLTGDLVGRLKTLLN